MTCQAIGTCDIPVINRVWPGLPLFRDEQIIQQPVNLETLSARLDQQAVTFLESNQDQPFFLYYAFPQPHTPLYAGAAFQNSTIRGPYGDAVAEVDNSVGVVLSTLERLGLQGNTLVFFSSDK